MNNWNKFWQWQYRGWRERNKWRSLAWNVYDGGLLNRNAPPPPFKRPQVPWLLRKLVKP